MNARLIQRPGSLGSFRHSHGDGAASTFVASSLLPDSEAGSPTLAPAMQQDMARVFSQLDLTLLRATVVDLHSLMLHADWSIAEDGSLSGNPSERTLDSVFPGATALVARLADADTDATQVQKLSPRLWAVGWRVDEHNAIIAEAHFGDRRDLLGSIDTALMRLACSASIGASLAAAPAPGAPAGSQALAWPQVDRRKRPPSRRRLGTAVLVLGAGMLSLCLMLLAQAEQMRKLAEATMKHGLATALVTGDYGDLQTALSQFAELGYFQSAAVSNAKGRTVALAGAPEGLRIGDAVRPDYAAVARELPLALGSEALGRLQFVAATQASGASLAVLRALAFLAAVAALAGAALILPWRQLRGLIRSR